MARLPRPANVKWFSERQKPRYRSRKQRSPCQLASLRLNDLARLFRARYGVVLPDDDAGRDDIDIAASHLASLAHPKVRIEKWLDLWAPWLSRAESAEIVTRAVMEQKHWTADQLAWRLRLTDADRTTLGITTIGAIDCNKAERAKRRKVRQRERMARLRLSQGRKPRVCAP